MICLEDDMAVERNLINQEHQGDEVLVNAIACDRNWSPSAMITGLRMPRASASTLSTAKAMPLSHFVSSMTAPVASGWSGCRVGFAPTGKRRLFTAHAKSRHQTPIF